MEKPSKFSEEILLYVQVILFHMIKNAELDILLCFLNISIYYLLLLT